MRQGDEPAFEVRVGECVELEADEVEVDGTPAPYVVLVTEMYQDVKVGVGVAVEGCGSVWGRGGVGTGVWGRDGVDVWGGGHGGMSMPAWKSVSTEVPGAVAASTCVQHGGCSGLVASAYCLVVMAMPEAHADTRT